MEDYDGTLMYCMCMLLDSFSQWEPLPSGHRPMISPTTLPSDDFVELDIRTNI